MTVRVSWMGWSWRGLPEAHTAVGVRTRVDVPRGVVVELPWEAGGVVLPPPQPESARKTVGKIMNAAVVQTCFHCTR